MKVQDLTIFRELKILNGMSDFYSILRKWRCIQRNFPNSDFSGSVPGFSILFRVGMHFWIVCYSHMGNSPFVKEVYQVAFLGISVPLSWGFLVHLLALIKLHGNYPPVHELLNTSGAFGNYILITYLSSTLHSNFSLPKHTLN